MNLPNGLTLTRIFLVPLLVAVLLTRYDMMIATAIFLAASLTDLLDGYIARKRGQVTTLGKLLDPTAYTGLCAQMARDSAKRARAAAAAWRGNP